MYRNSLSVGILDIHDIVRFGVYVRNKRFFRRKSVRQMHSQRLPAVFVDKSVLSGGSLREILIRVFGIGSLQILPVLFRRRTMRLSRGESRQRIRRMQSRGPVRERHLQRRKSLRQRVLRLPVEQTV